jgi:uncharacterized membrane protein YkoI
MAAQRNSVGLWPLLLGAAAGILNMIPAAATGAPPAAVPPTQAATPARTNTGLTMEQAVHLAEQRFKARVVRAEPERTGEHTVYVLRMLNEHGRVWTVRVDAADGRVQ